MKKTVVIIGGGASGMLAAYSIKRHLNKKDDVNVVIIEKNKELGKKLLITGKGRCNITFDGNLEYFQKNIVNNPKFMYSSFNDFSNKDMINLLEDNGVKTKKERGSRVFPVSDSSFDVRDILLKIIKELGVKILYSSEVTNLTETIDEKTGQRKIDKIYYKTLENGTYIHKYITSDSTIIATGGKSYPSTGSDGNMLKKIKDIGINVFEMIPSLVSFYTDENIKKLAGLTLKNVEVSLLVHNIGELKDNIKKEKVRKSELNTNSFKIFTERGEMMFSHIGITGPLVLSISSKTVKMLRECFKNKKDENILENINSFLKENAEISIDLKPALTLKELDERLKREISNSPNKEIQNILKELLPQKCILVFLEKSKIDGKIKGNSITKEDRIKIGKYLKNLNFRISKLGSFMEAVISSGGVDVKEINPKTMECKKIKGLYIVGEVLDIDALTGGFNLQIAWSTGFASGKDIAKKIEEQ